MHMAEKDHKAWLNKGYFSQLINWQINEPAQSSKYQDRDSH